MELCPKVAEYPWRIVLELEVIFGRRSQFISGAWVRFSDVLPNNVGKYSHIERELVSCVKVCICQFPIHLSISPRDGKTYASQHIVSGNPVDMVHVNFSSNHHPVVLFLLSLSPST